MASGPFKAIEDLAEAALHISRDALGSDEHIFDQGVYLLWDGEKIGHRPIVPEIVSEVSLDGFEALRVAEVESIFEIVESLGYKGFCHICKAQSEPRFHYGVCVILSESPLSTVLKFSFDSEEGNLIRLTMDSSDWKHLQRVFFSAEYFKQHGGKEIKIHPLR